jgi:integrase
LSAASDPLKGDIQRLTNEYRQHRGKVLDDAGAGVALDVVEFVFERLGGLARSEMLAKLADTRGSVADAIERVPQAKETFNIITGRSTPLLLHLDAWKAVSHRQGKTLDQMISDVRQFAATCPEPIETLSERHVVKWVESLLPNASANTVRRKLTSLRQYWAYLQAHEIVSRDRKPFSGVAVRDRRTEVERMEAQRTRFEPDELVSVWNKAADDKMLHSAILIASHTGARRQGVCDLTVKSIRKDKATGIEYLHLAEKSKSGVRDVPIHPAIHQLIHSLAKNADSEGFLIHSTNNRYGKRGDAIGKRFTRLKQQMGFDDRHVFHSIRHTVVFMFRRAGCPLEIRNQIIGHADDSVGAGYGGEIGLQQKLEWLQKALIYP